jgi:hypothetical protein
LRRSFVKARIFLSLRTEFVEWSHKRTLTAGHQDR